MIFVVGFVMFMYPLSGGEPVGSGFTYQGRLIDANKPADGLYDFQFKLFDHPNVLVGNRVGADVNVPDVDVIDGYFTVLLDFGREVFDGNAVWLEIGVRPGDFNDPNVYTALAPAQELAPAPYSLYAVKAAGFDVPMKFGDAAHTPMLSNTDIQLDHADSEHHILELRNNEGASLWGINQDGGTSFGPYTPGKDLHLFGGNQVRMTLKGDTGNIGLGLGPAAPTQRLDVAGGNIRVRGEGGFDVSGDSAYLYLGDQTHYIKSEWGLGLAVGSYLVPEALTIRDMSGDVGIGTSEPRARLHLADADEAAILLDNGGSVADWGIGTNAAGLFLIGSGTDTFSATRFWMGPGGDTYLAPVGGNVGLGDLPGEAQAALHVYAESSEFGMLKLQNSNVGDHEATIAFIGGSDVTPDEYWLAGVGMEFGTGWGYDHFSIGRSGPMFVISPQGKVGIGTTQPNSLLEVFNNDNTITTLKINNPNGGAGAGSRIVFSEGWFSSGASILYRNSGAYYLGNDPCSLEITNYDGRVAIDAGGTANRVCIQSMGGGNVGIGTKDPTSKLDVAGPVNLNKGKTGAALTVNGAEAIWYDGTYFSWGYGGQHHYFADKVGIGTKDPGSYMLAVNGDAAKTGSTTWSTLSDARLKTVGRRFERGLDEVMALNPVRYQYRQDNDLELADDQEHIGLVAQDVQRVIPEAVTENDKGYLMLNNDPVIMAMLNAIKELKAENKELRRQLDIETKRLAGKLEHLELTLGRLSQRALMRQNVQ
jgi:hypothetical protein